MRITGGIFRSRTISCPKGDLTRPTSDRVREALFSILSSQGVFSSRLLGPELRVLDLFAGSGSLGLEALSRGADFACFVEQSKSAILALKQNIADLKLETQCQIVSHFPQASRPSKLPHKSKQAESLSPSSSKLALYQLAFADPPYAMVQDGSALPLIEMWGSLLCNRALFVLEHSVKDEAPSFSNFQFQNTRIYGDTSLSFYQKEESISFELKT